MMDEVPLIVELKSSQVLGSGCVERNASTVARGWFDWIQIGAPVRGAG